MTLVQMSIAGGLMILAILAARAPLLCRLPKTTFLVLWACVALRPLVPVAIPANLNAYTLLADVTANLSVDTPTDGERAASKTTSFSEQGSEAPSPGKDNPSCKDTTASFERLGQHGSSDETASSPVLTLLASFPWRTVWAIGAITCAAGISIPYIRCRREFRSSLPVRNDFVTAWLAAHRLRRPIEIRQTRRVSSPLTYGVLRPVILMPVDFDWEDARRAGYILEHEFVHIRRCDVVWKAVLATCTCIHWFNPLVWAMNVFANRDLELACDSSVVRRAAGDARSDYAHVLIEMMEKTLRRAKQPLCSSFGATANMERIRSIMTTRKTTVAAIVVSAALVTGIPLAFATMPAIESPDNGASSETAEQTVIASQTAETSQATDAGDANRLPHAADGDLSLVSEETNMLEAPLDSSAAETIVTDEGTRITTPAYTVTVPASEGVVANVNYREGTGNVGRHHLELWIVPQDWDGSFDSAIEGLYTGYTRCYTIYCMAPDVDPSSYDYGIQATCDAISSDGMDIFASCTIPDQAYAAGESDAQAGEALENAERCASWVEAA